MSFAIMRTQKLKSAVAVRASLKHSYRDQETPNADSTLTQNNVVLQGASNTNEAMRDFREKLPEKIRKNGVQCVELLITASHDVMMGKSRVEQLSYFQDSLDWISEKFGGRKNIINAGVHYDERTPHMYVYVVPLDENGKLNCRKFMGGAKHVMSELQDSFAEVVGRKHGLTRGLKGSKAKHQTVAEYYKKLNKFSDQVYFSVEDLKPKKMGFLTKETTAGVAQRINQQISQLVAKASERDDAVKHYESAVTTANKHAEGIVEIGKMYKEVLGGLSQEQIGTIKNQANIMREENLYQIKQEEQERNKRELEQLQERVANRKRSKSR